MIDKKWPNNIKVAQIRIARPTNKFEEIKKFYGEGLGLPQIGSFKEHEGYNGVMFGLPGHDYHLEFTSHTSVSPYPAPTKDNLLVLYLPDKSDIEKIEKRLNAMGCFPVEPENPYWKEKGLTFEDPDGWRVVLMNTAGI